MTNTSEQILRALTKSDGYVTARELASLVGVSTKTIYRGVQRLNQKYGAPIIKSERGRGFTLNYERYLALAGKADRRPQLVAATPLARRNTILAQILFNAPLASNLQELYAPYYVSDDLVKQDLAMMEKNVARYHLTIERVRNLVTVKGNEHNIRTAISQVIIQGDAMNQESVMTFAREIPDIGHYDKRFLTSQLEWIQRSIGTTIPYPYNINIFSHLYVLIKRFRTGKVLDTKINAAQERRYTELIATNPRFFKISTDVIKNTAEYVHYQIPTVESYYLLEYLISMRYNHDFVFDHSGSAAAIQLADYFLAAFQLDVAAPRVQSLKNDLVGHLRPMMNRLNNQITVANKLLFDIRSEYADLYSVVRHAATKAEEDLKLPWTISDDEVGYLTLYFAKYLEEGERPKRALVMCASGVGTSKLLNAKVRRKFPDLEIAGITSKDDYELHPDRYPNIDIIISTVPVHPGKDTRVILTSAMFNDQDQLRLRRALNDAD